MAVVNTKSTAVTNADATPPVMNDLNIAGGRLREIVATVEVAVADTDLSVYRLARVHSSWRISAIQIFNDTNASGTDFNLGLYATAADGGAVVDDNVYGDAISMASARVVPLDATFEIRGIEKIEQEVWQDAGLSSDTGVWYDIALTGIVVGTDDGTISARIQYVAKS